MWQTWRWFGPNDPVSIDDLLQAGVQGVVTALHHLPPGTVWTRDEIAQRQREMSRMTDGSPSGLNWLVAESLPVSEAIKRQTGDWKEHVANYRQSLSNLHAAEVEVVCYNFMPVLDWTRTDLGYRLPNGATCMRFDYVDFAVFDIHLLKRNGAASDFPQEIAKSAQERFASMPDATRRKLLSNVVSGLPGGAASMSIEDVHAHLSAYNRISADQLRSNLIDFLAEVVPHAESLGVRLCCHPDDPPHPLLGLPRVMSSEAHFKQILNTVDSPSNGVALCSGSLGASASNDLPGMMKRMGERVHFLHLRDVKRETDAEFGSFHESEHLAGDTDMVALVAAVLKEEQKRQRAGRSDSSIPFRPDHGHNILDDHNRNTQPGYPAIGRLRGLAELRGLATALSHPSLSALT